MSIKKRKTNRFIEKDRKELWDQILFLGLDLVISKKINEEDHSFGMIYDFLNKNHQSILGKWSKKRFCRLLQAKGFSVKTNSYNKKDQYWKLQYKYSKDEIKKQCQKGQAKTIKIRKSSDVFNSKQASSLLYRRENSPRCIEFYLKKGLPDEEAKQLIRKQATLGAIAALKKTQKPSTEKTIARWLEKNNIEFLTQVPLKCSIPSIFGRKTLIYDFLIPDKKIIIEANGTYWHCDPELYKPTDCIKFPGKGEVEARDVWLADKQKIENASLQGYRVVTLWEREINDEQTLNEILKNEICKIS